MTPTTVHFGPSAAVEPGRTTADSHVAQHHIIQGHRLSITAEAVTDLSMVDRQPILQSPVTGPPPRHYDVF